MIFNLRKNSELWQLLQALKFYLINLARVNNWLAGQELIGWYFIVRVKKLVGPSRAGALPSSTPVTGGCSWSSGQRYLTARTKILGCGLKSPAIPAIF